MDVQVKHMLCTSGLVWMYTSFAFIPPPTMLIAFVARCVSLSKAQTRVPYYDNSLNSWNFYVLNSPVCVCV